MIARIFRTRSARGKRLPGTGCHWSWERKGMTDFRLPLLSMLACAGLVLTGCAGTPRTGVVSSSGAERGAPAVGAASARLDAAANMPGTDVRRASATALEVGAPRGDFAGTPALERFIARMEGEGFDRAELTRLFAQVRRQQWILDHMHRNTPRPSAPPSRPTGAWPRYRDKFVTQSNLAEGTAFWHRHAATLARAERQFGVPAEYIVAIIGVETRWGGHLGSHRVIDALATLGFEYPRRSEFFTDELAHFLIMARDERIDPLKPVGSFAGAMGLGQFMPSSFRRFAIDFDGDGRRDLWNPEDAIGSVANYFVNHGWRPGQPVVARARVNQTLPMTLEVGFPSNYGLTQLAALGIDTSGFPADQQRLSLLRLDIGSGYEYWIGFDNFYAITRYNHSTFYAMAVHQLAQALRERQDRTALHTGDSGSDAKVASPG